MIKPNPAAIGIGAPILCGTRVPRGPKRKTRRTDRRVDGELKPGVRQRLRADARSVTLRLPMRPQPRAGFPRARLPKPQCSKDVTLAVSFSFARKPRIKKPWEARPTRVRMNTREATSLAQRETLQVQAIRFLHGGGRRENRSRWFETMGHYVVSHRTADIVVCRDSFKVRQKAFNPRGGAASQNDSSVV